MLKHLLVSALAAFALGQATSPPPDLVLHNGQVLTVDGAFRVAEAVAITGGRISAVGSSSAILAAAGPATRRIDLKGATLIPGLMDNHLHSAGGGPGVDLSRARSIDEVLQAVAARVAHDAARRRW